MVKDHLKNWKQYETLHPLFPKAFAFIQKAVEENFAVGKYELEGKELYAMVQEYDTKTDDATKTEAHRKYIDIQFLVSGRECIQVFDMEQAVPLAEFDGEKDVGFYQNDANATACILQAGDYCILFPWDAHRPGMCLNNLPAPVKKIVVKIKM